MKKHTPSNKKARKVLASFGMAALLFTGGIAATSLVDARALPHSGTIKAIQDNPLPIIKDNNLAIDPNFDYFDELNRAFSEKDLAVSGSFIDNSSVNEGELKKALDEKDYFAWRVALGQNFEDPNNVPALSEKEFKLLSELKKSQGDE